MSEEYSVGYSEGYQAGWNAAMDATPPAQPAVPLTDEQQIAEALRQHGLTLVKTSNGYAVLRLGQIDAHGIGEEHMKLKWQQAPVKTQWGDEMVVASVAIDKDNTVCLYCERDQTPKVDAMFAQRTWVGLTHEEKQKLMWIFDQPNVIFKHFKYMEAIEAKLKEKNNV